MGALTHLADRVRAVLVGGVLVAALGLIAMPPHQAVAAPAFVQVKTNSGVGTSLTATYSPAAVAGHLLVAVCGAQGSRTFTTPSGFTVAKNESGSTVSQAIYYKVATGGETNVACTTNASGPMGIHIYEYSGIHTYTTLETVNATASSGNSTTPSSGSLTTLHTNDLIFAAITIDTDNTNNSWTNSFTSRTGSFGISTGKKNDRAYFDAADLTVTSTGSYSTTGSMTSTANWRGQIVAFRSLANSPALTMDIVNAGGTPVASPSVTLSNISKSFNCQTPTGTLGVAAQKIRVNNTTDNPAWSLTIAATSGPTALWNDGAGHTYDFNSSAGSGCTNGQLTVSAGSGTLTPQTNCTNTNVALGTSASFNQGITDAIAIASATTGSQIDCYWDITGVGLSQKVPANQAAGTTYSLNLTLTITAN